MVQILPCTSRDRAIFAWLFFWWTKLSCLCRINMQALFCKARIDSHYIFNALQTAIPFKISGFCQKDILKAFAEWKSVERRTKHASNFSPCRNGAGSPGSAICFGRIVKLRWIHMVKRSLLRPKIWKDGGCHKAYGRISKSRPAASLPPSQYAFPSCMGTLS